MKKRNPDLFFLFAFFIIAVGSLSIPGLETTGRANTLTVYMGEENLLSNTNFVDESINPIEGDWKEYWGTQWGFSPLIDLNTRKKTPHIRVKDDFSDAFAAAVQWVEVPENSEYKLVVEAKVGKGTPKMRLDFMDATRKELASYTSNSFKGNTWKRYKVKGTAPPGTKYARVVLYSTKKEVSTSYWRSPALKVVEEKTQQPMLQFSTEKDTYGVGESIGLQGDHFLPTRVDHFQSDYDGEIQGYIVEFKDNMPASDYRKGIAQMLGMPTKEVSVLNEYRHVLKGVAVRVSSSEAAILETHPQVKRVHPNLRVNVSLDNSVPQIHAPEVWEQDEQGLACGISGKECITGKGIRIGIIDTGVDYTHESLGSSVMEERPLKRISSQTIKGSKGFSFFSFNQRIAVQGNKVFYPYSQNIVVYDLDSQEEMQIKTPLDFVHRIMVKGDRAVFAGSTFGGFWQVWLLDLESGDQTFLFERPFLERVHLIDDAVIFSQTTEVFKYDLVTGTTTKLLKGKSSLVDGGKVVSLFKDGLVCYDGLTVLDLTTGEKNLLFPPDIGPILDLKDNLLLYAACSKSQHDKRWRSYYLYDIVSESYEELSFEKIDDTALPGKAFPNAAWKSETSWIATGNVEGDLIYFSKNVDANRIVAHDKRLGRSVVLNRLIPSFDFDAEGNRVCFIGHDFHVYCHTYDRTLSYEHAPVFNKKVVGGYDFVDNDEDPFDEHGHGTHVASIAAGNGNLVGVAPEAEIYAYRVLDAFGSGYTSNIINAIERSVDPNSDGDTSDHLDVIGLSLGAPCRRYSVNCGPDDIRSKALDTAASLGVVAVVAAGNEGHFSNQVGSPGTSRKAITVGAVDRSDREAPFSNGGPVWWSNASSSGMFSGYDSLFSSMIKPEVSAPGVSICGASWPYALFKEPCKEGYVSMSGTSMAAPHLVGVVSLIKQKFPRYTPQDIKQAIIQGALSQENVDAQGYGRVDALKSTALEGDMLLLPHIDTGGVVPVSQVTITGKLHDQDRPYTLFYRIKGQDWTPIQTMEGEEEQFAVAWDMAFLGSQQVYLKIEGQSASALSVLRWRAPSQVFNVKKKPLRQQVSIDLEVLDYFGWVKVKNLYEGDLNVRPKSKVVLSEVVEPFSVDFGGRYRVKVTSSNEEIVSDPWVFDVF